jgi:hypothetical protein
VIVTIITTPIFLNAFRALASIHSAMCAVNSAPVAPTRENTSSGTSFPRKYMKYMINAYLRSCVFYPVFLVPCIMPPRHLLCSIPIVALSVSVNYNYFLLNRQLASCCRSGLRPLCRHCFFHVNTSACHHSFDIPPTCFIPEKSHLRGLVFLEPGLTDTVETRNPSIPSPKRGLCQAQAFKTAL